MTNKWASRMPPAVARRYEKIKRMHIKANNNLGLALWAKESLEAGRPLTTIEEL